MLLMAVLLEESITLKLPSLKILTGIALIAVLFWKIFATSGEKAVSTIRKLLLAGFSFFGIFPYVVIVEKVKKVLIVDYDINYKLSEIFNQYKGTDWADGILTMFFIALYAYWVIHLWKLDAKLDKKPPEEKPIKIEAKIGNIKNERE